ncbi:MAG: EAL domain-containing protein [Marinobacter sp.]|uniref:bifunctional diguanylate cyclase/phosphodiesterase n=1 Tax=unclassified Marinobacter TaxID=83889 RepID=UPI00273CF046|nr:MULTISPECIES: EAL domain-containing protein [unclassified Marinobacter]MDP4547462.1 EAL domain-containing protein [Marinobacter sp. MDS2]
MNSRRQDGVMSLRALLLVFTGSLLVLILLTIFSVTFNTFRNYVSSQHLEHARDAATATGVALSKAVDASDIVAASSLIDAVFDSGSYLSVKFYGHGRILLTGREIPLRTSVAPDWFVRAAKMQKPEGKAQVVRGWAQLGTVEVVSNLGRAYDDLWRITLGLLAAVVLIGGVGMLGLWFLLKRLLQPLSELEKQARALSRRDFRERVAVRSTRELNQVTEAMNQMADDLGQLFAGQGKLIQHLRKVNNEDPVTGLASRSAFDQRLKVEVESEEKSAPGVLMLLQLSCFGEFNQSHGREEGDRLLKQVGKAMNTFVMKHGGAFAGRRTGAEFAAYLPGASAVDVKVWCEALVETLDGLYSDLAAPVETCVHAGLAIASPEANVRDLLAAADTALRTAQQREESCCWIKDASGNSYHTMDTWRDIINDAIRGQKLSLWLQPMVQGPNQELQYFQVFSRICTPEGVLKAGAFVPMAERLGLIADIDRVLVASVLQRLAHKPEEKLAISLGSASVADETFREDLLSMLGSAGTRNGRLWVGISEMTLHHHRAHASQLIRALVKLHVPVLVDRFGVGGVPFNYLRNLPLSGLRIDNSFVHDLDSHEDNRFWLESVIGIARSRGVKVFATGVERSEEYSVLCKLGIDGAMGYHLGRPFAADEESTGE